MANGEQRSPSLIVCPNCADERSDGCFRHTGPSCIDPLKHPGTCLVAHVGRLSRGAGRGAGNYGRHLRQSQHCRSRHLVAPAQCRGAATALATSFAPITIPTPCAARPGSTTSGWESFPTTSAGACFGLQGLYLVMALRWRPSSFCFIDWPICGRAITRRQLSPVASPYRSRPCRSARARCCSAGSFFFLSC